MRSRIRAGVELLEEHEAVAGEQVGQGEEPVGVVERRRHQDDLRAGRSSIHPRRERLGAPTPSHIGGLVDDDHLGRAGRTAAADAVGLRRRGVGPGAERRRRRWPAARPGRRAEVDAGVDDGEHALALPVGQVPPHGDGHRTELPRREHRRPRARGSCRAAAPPGRRGRRRAASSAWPIWFERRSSSDHVMACSPPSPRANTMADAVGVARRRARRTGRRRRSWGWRRGRPHRSAGPRLTRVSP